MIIKYTTLIIILFLVIGIKSSTFQQENNVENGPVIGIFTIPSDFEEQYPKANYSFFGAGYVKFLESAGARVIALRYDYDLETLKYLFDHINGILFPGGDPSLWANETTKTEFSEMTKKGMYLYQLAVEANNNGDYFPLWGTCLGYEMMLMATTHDPKILDNFVQDDESEKYTYTDKKSVSRILKTMPEELVNYSANNPVAYYFHKYGKLYSTFRANRKLESVYNVIATAFDDNNQEFVTLVEGKKYPFYGTQNHPEVQQFQNKPNLDLNKNPNTILFSQYMGRFFVNESRKSKHKFFDFNEYCQWAIYNYKPVISPDDWYDMIYVFRNYNVTLIDNNDNSQQQSINKLL